MDTLTLLWQGLVSALTLPHLAWAFAGVTVGTAVGVLPGIGPALTVAILLPATFSLEPTSAFIMFGGIYYGAMYGGSTTSILINAPGETASIVTAMDGHVMALQGRASAALATAAIGSFVAGTLATLGLTFFAPALASVALRFGPAEYFAPDDSRVQRRRGVTWIVARARSPEPLSRSCDRPDRHRSAHRHRPFCVRSPPTSRRGRRDDSRHRAFRRGRDAVPSMDTYERRGVADSAGPFQGNDSRRLAPLLEAVAPGTLIGFPLGVLPCGGSVIPTFVSYMVEKRLSARPEEFGNGAIEGVAGPEAANNAAAAGVLVPLLTLGLPSSATAAVLLTAFQQYGMQPGPLLFMSRPDLVWTLIASLYIGNMMLLVLNLPLAPVWARVMLIPRSLLFAGVLVLASIGAYSLNRSFVDLVLLYIVGVVGCAMRIQSIPLVPAVMGLTLGPLAELQFRRALAISEDNVSAILTRPICAFLLVSSVAVLFGPWLLGPKRTASQPSVKSL